jgi:hypothetical protein
MTHSLSEKQLTTLDAIADFGQRTGRALQAISLAVESGTPPEHIVAQIAELRHDLGTQLAQIQVLIVTINDA